MTDRAVTSNCVPFCKGTSKPICRPSLTSISSLPTAPPQASKELARPKSALAHSLLPYPSCLDQVERFFRLITRHAHPAPPTSKNATAYRRLQCNCTPCMRTPDPNSAPGTSRDVVGELPERSCVAGTKTEERRRRIVAQYGIWRMRLRALKATVTRRSRKGTSALVVEAIKNKQDPTLRAL